MNDSRVFIDTNIFIYTMLDDKFEQKRKKINELFKSLEEKDIYISTQVLNEIYSVMLKYGANDNDIKKNLSAIIKETIVSQIQLKTIKLCWEIRPKYKYSYWDSLILASALENDCGILYSEDMQHNQLIEKTLKIIDPFMAQ